MWPKSFEELIAYSECEKNARRLVSEENHCKYIADNVHLDCVYHIQIDGKVIPKKCVATKRVDYLIINETKMEAYLIELKTKHIVRAFEQLEISNASMQGLLEGYCIKWRIVHQSRTLKMYSDVIRKYKKIHKNLIIARTPKQEDI